MLLPPDHAAFSKRALSESKMSCSSVATSKGAWWSGYRLHWTEPRSTSEEEAEKPCKQHLVNQIRSPLRGLNAALTPQIQAPLGAAHARLLEPAHMITDALLAPVH